MEDKKNQYLIIGGTTKAATTSLFSYLAEHPEICAANTKETRFFLDSDYPLSSRYRLEDGMDKYERFFGHCCDNRLRLEATPDYLHSPGTPQRIRNSLHAVRFVFILREPISRLISWYRYARQIGSLPEDVSFGEYVELQRQSPSTATRAQHLLALEQGCYSRYLRDYLDLFGAADVHITFYEHLSSDPEHVLRGICAFAGVESAFYSTYHFRTLNKTRTMKSATLNRYYMQMHFNVRKYTCNKPIVHSVLRWMRLRIEPKYLQLNTKPDPEIALTASTKSFLDSYYHNDLASLEALLGRTAYWTC